MPAVWQLKEAEFRWGDLPPDEEAARCAAKLANAYAGVAPYDLLIEHYRGPKYACLQREIEPIAVKTVPLPVTRQFGVRDIATGVETWAPPGTEGETCPEVTVNTVRSLCGIIDLERAVASLKAQVRTLQAELAEVRVQRVSVGRVGA